MRTTERTVRRTFLILGLLLLSHTPARAALTVSVTADPGPCSSPEDPSS